jgi:hypothetical protein
MGSPEPLMPNRAPIRHPANNQDQWGGGGTSPGVHPSISGWKNHWFSGETWVVEGGAPGRAAQDRMLVSFFMPWRGSGAHANRSPKLDLGPEVRPPGQR